MGGVKRAKHLQDRERGLRGCSIRE